MQHKRLIRFIFVAAAIVIALSTLAPAANAAPPGSPFTGVWQSIDVDASHQRLAINNGAASGTWRLNLYDDGASVCIPLVGAMVPALVRGTGTASGNTLTMTYSGTCLSHPQAHFSGGPFSYTYNPGTDTMTDSAGIVWHRQGKP